MSSAVQGRMCTSIGCVRLTDTGRMNQNSINSVLLRDAGVLWDSELSTNVPEESADSIFRVEMLLRVRQLE